MTSSAQPSAKPKRRWRSGATGRARLLAKLRRWGVVLGAIAIFGGVVGWYVKRPITLDPLSARQALIRSGELLRHDNANAAYDQALVGIRGEPQNPLGHIALAMAFLALDDGIGAEGSIQHALNVGYDPKLVPHLRAHALLLQGKADEAIALARQTDPQFEAYGLRIQGRAFTALGDYAAALETLNRAIAVAPDDPAVWLDMGRFRYVAGDMLGAKEAADRAVNLAPGNVQALILRGQLVRSQFGLVAALPWFERALERDPRHHDALIEYAATLGDQGRTVDALAATRRAMATRSGSPQALYLQAVIAARAENFDLARSILARVSGPVAGLPATLLLAASLDLEAGKYETAQGKLQALVSRQPMNISARKLLAFTYLRMDAARNAIDMLRPVVARADADSYALTLVARGYERIGEFETAAAYLDRAASPIVGDARSFSADSSLNILAARADARPNDPGLLVPLLRGLIDSGNSPGALARAQAIVARNKGAPAAHSLLGDMYMLLKRPADAVLAYRSAADLRFDEPIMLRLVEAFEASGRRDEAAKTLAFFQSENPTNRTALRLAGLWQLSAGEYDLAIDSFEELRSQIGDGDAALNALLASAYTGVGELETALELGEAAYALAPMNPAVADAYGWALFRAGDLTPALQLLEKAVNIAPNHAGLRWHMAQIYAEAKRPAEAKAAIRAALSDSSFADRTAAQALLAKLG